MIAFPARYSLAATLRLFWNSGSSSSSMSSNSVAERRTAVGLPLLVMMNRVFFSVTCLRSEPSCVRAMYAGTVVALG